MHYLNKPDVVCIVNGCTKLNQLIIERIRNGAKTFIYQDDSLFALSFNISDVTLQIRHGQCTQAVIYV